MNPPTVMLMSDFGPEDLFVAEVTARLMALECAPRVLHATHSIRPHDVAHAAFQLAAWLANLRLTNSLVACLTDPDPGCRLILADHSTATILAPDNGTLSLVSPGLHNISEVTLQAHDAETPGSATFRGRDVFPAVIQQWSERRPGQLPGSPVSRVRRLPDVLPQRLPDGSIRGQILHIDHFGNLITNVTSCDLAGRRAAAEVGDWRIDTWGETYPQLPADCPFLLTGSAGFLEISLNAGRAADRLGVGIGTPVIFSTTDCNATD